jgi:hypothetical protein
MNTDFNGGGGEQLQDLRKPKAKKEATEELLAAPPKGILKLG